MILPVSVPVLIDLMNNLAENFRIDTKRSKIDALMNQADKSPMLAPPSDPYNGEFPKLSGRSKKSKNKDLKKEELGDSKSENSVSNSEINIEDMEALQKGTEDMSESSPNVRESKLRNVKKLPSKPHKHQKNSLKIEKNNHIRLKYNPKELNEEGTEYKESTDEEILDDEYDDEGEGEDGEESLDELLFLEAVASLNENISMLTINSTDIFNWFQSLVKETNLLSSTLQEFNKQLVNASGKVEKDISQEIQNINESGDN